MSDVAAETWILYRSEVTLAVPIVRGLVDVRSRLTKQVGVRRRKSRRRVRKRMTGQLHTGPPLTGCNRSHLFTFSVCGVTGKPASGLQVRWWCYTEDTTSLLPGKINKWNFTRYVTACVLLVDFYVHVQHKSAFLPVFEANTPHSERASTGWRWAVLCMYPADREREKERRTLQVSSYLQYRKLPLEVHVKLWQVYDSWM